MDREAKWLRDAVAKHEPVRGKPYDSGLRERAVSWSRAQRAAGRTWEAIGAELGIGLDTVRRWCLSESSSTALVPVTVVEESTAPHTVSVVSPSGFRVDGLSLIEAAALLRELE